MKLYICEKPSQGRDLARILGCGSRGEGCLRGGDITVTWCVGHLLELQEPEEYNSAFRRWSLEDLPIIPERYAYRIRNSAASQYRAVRDLVAAADTVFIATDFDREGEAIARTLLDRFRYHGPVFRVCLTALDDASIRKALAAVRNGQETEPLYRSALGRSRADWLVGMNLSRLFSLLGRGTGYPEVIQIGRVITPTTALVVRRDEEISSFVPVPYFELWITAETPRGSFRARWKVPEGAADPEGRCLRRQDAEEAARRVDGRQGSVTMAERKRIREAPPLPFDLTSLQQYASRRWGYTAERTLNAAQSLYEKHKAATYPRSDCRYLPESQLADAPGILQAVRSALPGVSPDRISIPPSRAPRCFNTSKVEAHHAIIPTGNPPDMGAMTPDERNIYTALAYHYLIQFMPDAQYDSTSLEVTCGQDVFTAKGRILADPGFRSLLSACGLIRPSDQEEDQEQSGEGEDRRLPDVRQGDVALIRDPEILDRQTTPPPHFTEATLLAAMEHIAKYVSEERYRKILKETAGIGTPATRAAIIESALRHGYLVRSGKHLLSTGKARTVIPALPPGILSAGLTAAWEQELDQIARDQGSLEHFMTGIENWIRELIAEYRQPGRFRLTPVPGAPEGRSPADGTRGRRRTSSRRGPRKTASDSAPVEGAPSCPRCGQPMVRRQTRQDGRAFWGCSGYPSCRGTLPLDGGAASSPGAPMVSRTHQAQNSMTENLAAGSPQTGAGSFSTGFPPPSATVGMMGLAAGTAGAPRDGAQAPSTPAPTDIPAPGRTASSQPETGSPLCPRCGQPMVRRHARKDGSAFWGCSGYPACRGTLPLGSPDPARSPADGTPGRQMRSLGGSFSGVSLSGATRLGARPGAGQPDQEEASRIPDWPGSAPQETIGMIPPPEECPPWAAPSEPVVPQSGMTPQHQEPAAADPVTPPLCPRCGQPMVRRQARKDGSAFWGCSGYPACRGTMTNDGISHEGGQGRSSGRRRSPPGRSQTNRKNDEGSPTPRCPRCGAPMILRQGRSGRGFFGCSRYPACRGTLEADGHQG